MKDEKQIIEKMAKVLSTVKRCDAFVVSECIKRKCEYPHFNGVTCIAEHQAKALYDAGYRRQTEGEWVFEHEFYGKMLCSNCKKEALTNECSEYVDSDFCPNCGAKMKGGTE